MTEMTRREQIKAKFNEVKESIKQNKTAYIAGTVGVAIGVGATLLATHNGDQFNTIAQSVIVNRSKAKHIEIYQQMLERRGHPGNMILCNETGEIFASQNRAAAANELSASLLSQHLAGKFPTAKGMTFTDLGEAAA